MNKKVFGLLLSTYLLKGDSLINWQFAKELDPCQIRDVSVFLASSGVQII